jgi:hypothetical protein
LARLLLTLPEVELALDEVKQAFTALQKTTSIDRFQTYILLLNAYSHWLQDTNDHDAILNKIAATALTSDPSRPMAHLVYEQAPQQSQQILLNLTLRDIHRLTDRLCG